VYAARGKDEDDLHQEDISHISALSGAICFENAVKISRILTHYRRCFETWRMPFIGLHHAEVAATIYIARITLLKDASERMESFLHLQHLTKTVSELSQTYQPAEEMLAILTQAMEEIQRDFPDRRSPDNISMNTVSGNQPALSASHSFDNYHQPASFGQRSNDGTDTDLRHASAFDSIGPRPKPKLDIVWSQINPGYDPIFGDHERKALGISGPRASEEDACNSAPHGVSSTDLLMPTSQQMLC
jgi:hypothetical protein